MKLDVTVSIAGCILAVPIHAQAPDLEILRSLQIEPSITHTVIQAQKQFSTDSPRFQSPPVATQRPTLAGAEGITVQSFRAATGQRERYSGLADAEKILYWIDQSVSMHGDSLALEIAGLMMGWANMQMNWAQATLLGDSVQAVEFMRQAIRLEAQANLHTSMELFPSTLSDDWIHLMRIAPNTTLLSTAEVFSTEASCLILLW